MSSSTYIQSIRRAIAILRCFTEVEPEMGVLEISRRLELHKSTVSRALSTLQHEGLVGQNPVTGKYRLGLGLISLAGVALGRLDVRAAAQPYLGDLVETSQETVNVTVLDGDECVNIDRHASPKPIRYVGWIGRRTPLHCTASGKVLLAFMGPEERLNFLPSPLIRYTDRTITELRILEEHLARICQQGYAITHEEFEEGFSAIAAPIFNHRKQAVGTLSISGPTFRIGPGNIEAFIEPLLKTTHAISAEMGYM
jgi:DNA-binding IclR family transcriptional regulator